MQDEAKYCEVDSSFFYLLRLPPNIINTHNANRRKNTSEVAREATYVCAAAESISSA